MRPDIGAFKEASNSSSSSSSILPYLRLESSFTPNLDSLAADSAIFTRNYANIAICGPSRKEEL